MIQVPEYSDLIGIPFREHGRNSDSGLSCWGLVQKVYSRVGINLVDPRADEEGAGAQWDALPGWVQPSPLDVIGIDSKGLGVVGHVALYLGKNRVIESAVNTGVREISIDQYRGKILYYYRYRQ